MKVGKDDLLVELVARAAGLEHPSGFQRLDHGKSGDIVLRLGGHQTYFAKIGDPARGISVAELVRESSALEWLAGRAGAALLVWSGHIGDRPALVTEAIPGVALHELSPEQAEAGALAAIAALSELHSLPITECRFDERLPVKMREANRRVAAGEIDISNFDDQNADRSAVEVWRNLTARQPPKEDLVVTHGDACWPNFILRPDGEVGLVDLGRAGVADRHQDLALFIRSAGHNFPGLPIRALIAARYRLAPLDEQKVEFYQELDEFF
jgi:aminoglycoside 3'-phosphotransferase-2